MRRPYSLSPWLVQGCLTKAVVTLITQTVVDSTDLAFKHPTKPIGPFYSTEEAARHGANNQEIEVIEDAGRGWRRIVPSPMPVDIIEK